MTTTQSISVQLEDRPDPSAIDGPAPHEDLTIGELLETMRACGEHRTGEHCFVNEKGDARWFDDADVLRFVTEYGSEHPSTYHRLQGVDWQNDFFLLVSHKQSCL
ncbi:MAG: hypothetical protein V4819_04230 [Verrucomicrobiota bacterium]